MGRNNADFEGISFSHTSDDYGSLVHATHPEQGMVGYLKLHRDGNARNIFVKDEYRRKGIATQMWEYAKKQGLNPQHSDSRTYLGNAWAKSLKEDLPTNDFPTSDRDYSDYYGRD